MTATAGTLEAVEAALLEAIGSLRPCRTAGAGDDLARTIDVFTAQCLSRHCDHQARYLRSRGRGFYTIGSAGHEANAWVADALTTTDPALLHYRSGGFYCRRAHQHGGIDPVEDIMLGVLASTDEPIAGGRHKVFGRRDLEVLPQTSTIASHLPRAMGLALTLGRPRRNGQQLRYPRDAVVVCSFGDASVNHSTAQGAINAAANASYQQLPLPLLLVCEDNGLGISVRTPTGWVRETLAHRPGITYLHADGADAAETAARSREAVDIVRRQRRPAILHISTVRFGGHAGTDVESSYRNVEHIRADYQRDPLLATARRLIEHHGMDPDDVLTTYETARRHVADVTERLGTPRQLTDADEVMRPLAPRNPGAVAAAVRSQGIASVEGLTLAQAVNRTLDCAIAADDVVVFGEDVAGKGGVYGVTRGLARKHGAARVFDTILDEQSILGVALGAANAGMVPVPEIQYLAYLHNAEDQLRGEAATMQFFSQGAYRNGMVVRIAGYGYQKGFGGHFHNDNSIAVLRDIPGLVIASPARADDAASMLQTLITAARIDGTVSVFLEPIALYHTGGLHEDNDRGWLANGADHVPIGSSRLYRDTEDDDHADLLIVTYANGVPMSLRAARRLRQNQINADVLDLRWLAPLPIDDITQTAGDRPILIVDETRRSGGVSEGVLGALLDAGHRGNVGRVCSKDSFIPLGDAARCVLLSEDDIVDGARKLLES